MILSCIVASRNRWLNLNNTLNALIDQTLDKSEYEIIISDDNSDDETFKLYENNKTINGLHLKYVNNNTKPHTWNASIPRNLGALIANPESRAFVFIDSDVILPAAALQYYKDDLEYDSNRVVIGYYDFMDRNGVDVLIQDVRHLKFEQVAPQETFNTVHDGLACFGGNIMIPKEIFWSVGGFSPEIHIGLEDGDMGLKLWKKETNFSYDFRIKGTHQWHETPTDRFPKDMKDHIDNLNLKHFHSKDPDYGIIEASRDTYATWGIEGWQPPEEWKRMEMGLKVNKT
jgi:glycosyltransferase involved in cell wall biosynthesis